MVSPELGRVDALEQFHFTFLAHQKSGQPVEEITRFYDGLVTSGDGACDSPSPAIPQAYGRLTESRSNLASEGIMSLTRHSAYDELGRILASQQTTSGSEPFVFQYAYDRAGQPTAITYPTGRTLTTIYDNAERPVSLSGAVNGGAVTQYASEASYAPHGGLASMTVNPGTTQWTESRGYNSRLQTVSLSSAGVRLGYDYGGTGNNGDAMSSTATPNNDMESEHLLRREPALRGGGRGGRFHLHGSGVGSELEPEPWIRPVWKPVGERFAGIWP